MSVCPTVSVLRFYGCCYPCFCKSYCINGANYEIGFKKNHIYKHTKTEILGKI